MIRIHWNLTLLQFSSDDAAEEVGDLVDVESCTLVQLSRSSRIVDEEKAESLLEELQQKGYRPRVERP